MKKMTDNFKALVDKNPLLFHALAAIVKTFVIAGAAAAVIFLLLSVTGVYPNLETALDLKYNSPIILVPLCVLAALFLLCLTVGLLMYFHKYKRTKAKTPFSQKVTAALDNPKPME